MIMPKARRMAKRVQILGAIGVAYLVATQIIACSVVFHQEDNSYLTPIPRETLETYKLGTPIENKLQAAIAARRELESVPHFRCVGMPAIVGVEELMLVEARKRLEQPGSYTSDHRPDNTKVWFIIVECDWQIYPPPIVSTNATATLPAPFHGCSYMIIQAVDAVGSEIGSIECPCENYGNCATVVPTATQYPTTTPFMYPAPILEQAVMTITPNAYP
jgi:hypothetical protein